MAVIQMPTKGKQNNVEDYLKNIAEASYDELMVVGIKDGGASISWSQGTSLIHALGLLEVLKAELIKESMVGG